MICLADNTEHADEAALHKHIRFKLKLKQADYYTQYQPRYCRQTGEAIPFKDLEQYLATDFIDKNALKKWMKENPQEGAAYAIQMIERRAVAKSLTYALSEVELKSLGMPRVKYYETIGGHNVICDQLGLETRFNYGPPAPPSYLPRPITIDTREQQPLKLPRTVVEKLEYGDYALQADPLVAVERKSLQDLIGTLIVGYERFEREILRAKEVGGYLVVLCETDISSALSFDYLPHIKRHTNIKPQIVFHNLRALMQAHECVQFAFCDGRVHMAKVIAAVLNWGDKVRRYDLQHLISEGVI